MLVAVAIVGCAGDRHGGTDRSTTRRNPYGCIVGVNVRNGDVPARHGDLPTRRQLETLCRRQEQAGSRLPAAGNLPSPKTRDPRVPKGRRVVVRAGCLACHRIGVSGNDGPGPDLTVIGDRLLAASIRRALTDPVAPMPSYRSLAGSELTALVAYLSELRGAGG